MCSRADQTYTQEEHDKHYGMAAPDHIPLMNLGIGDYVTTHVMIDKRVEVVTAKWGIPAFWNPKLPLFNARMEGDLNQTDSMDYKGLPGIVQKPAFRNLLKNNRCIVPVSAFYEGPKEFGLKKPYRIYEAGHKFMDIIALYEKVDTEYRICLLTTPSSTITNAVGHHRAPFIINSDQREDWLSDRWHDLQKPTETWRLLLENWGYEAHHWVAEPVNPEAMKVRRSADLQLFKPVGQKIAILIS